MLERALKTALADTFTMAAAAQMAHWNVTGPGFPALHQFFGDIYADVFAAVDAIAEEIIASGGQAPRTLLELLKPGSLAWEGGAAGTTLGDLVAALIAANEAVQASLTVAAAAAVTAGKVGTENVLQDRIARHAKWGWQLKRTAGL